MESKGIPQGKLTALYEVGKLINSTLEFDAVLQSTMDGLIQVTGAERGFIMLINEQSGELEFKVARNMDRETIEDSSSQISQSIVRRVVAENRGFLIGDALADPNYNKSASVVLHGLRSIMCAPIQVKERTIGIVYVDSRLKTGLFSNDDLRLTQAFAAQAGIAIENARLYHRVKEQFTDISEMKAYQDNIFRSVTSGIIALDTSGRITSFNREAEIIFGRPVLEALNKPYTEVLGQRLSQKLLKPMARLGARGEGNITDCEVEFASPTTGQRYLSLDISVLRNQRGWGVGFVLVADDLTEKKMLEAARLREEEEKNRIRNVFCHYVAPRVVERLLLEPDRIALGGEKQTLTVLFADIRGFTSLSERMEPNEVVALLNKYLAAATKAIFEYEGTLDKFLGDAVLAFFNAPVPQPDHAIRAVRAAIQIQKYLAEASADSSIAVSCGIGINTGEAVVGNIGAEQLMNYTVIGDVVNTAQRLQANAKPGQILLSKETYECLNAQVPVEHLGVLQVKGRTAGIEVCQVLT